jgi:hypothetical protein
MKKIIAITIIAFITTSLVFVSCKKNEDLVNSPALQTIKQTRSGIESYNGILAFENMSILKTHIASLEAIVYPTTETENFNKSELVKELESGFQYISYGKGMESWLSAEEGFENPENNPKSNLGGPIMKSILNKDYEIIIDNEYFNFKYKGYYIFIKDIKSQELNKIRTIINANTDPIICVNEFHKTDIPATISMENFDISKKTRGNTAFQISTNNTWVIQGTAQTADGCSNKNVTLADINPLDGSNITGQTKNGDITIAWGDGTSNTVNNQKYLFGVPVNGVGNKVSFNHTYPTTGQYTIIITFAQGINGGGLVGSCQLPILAGGCINAFGQSFVKWNYPVAGGNNFAVKREIWMNNNWIYHRIGAETDTYKKNSKGKYKNFKCSTITANIDGDLATTGCSPFTTFDYDTDTNDDDAECCKAQGVDYNFVKIKSTHIVNLGGTSFTYNDEIKACP